MPFLALEPSVFPENLLTEVGRTVNGRRWWVMYTKSRQEKALVRTLGAQQVPHYLPLVAREQLIRGRPVTSHVPVFPSYVFVYGDVADRERCLKTNRVCQVLSVPNGEELCEDLASVQSMIESGCPLTVESRLEPGNWVRVRSGPLEGLEGAILKRKRQTRLVVAVRMLQQGVSVEISDYLVEPITAPLWLNMAMDPSLNSLHA
jgi:transcriptional antiterminator RfaH